MLTLACVSLHHGRLFHASGPNRSDDRRIGMVIRYVTPAVKQQVGERDYAMLVRGADRGGHWINVAAPLRPFEPEALALYETIQAEHVKILGQGVKSGAALYQGAG